MSAPDPERPEGLETRPPSTALPAEPNRPDWLVGAGDVLENEERPENPDSPKTPVRLTVSDAAAARGALRVVPGGKPDPPKGWAGAASSVPKLSVVPTRDQSVTEPEDDPASEEPEREVALGSHDPEVAESPRSSEPAFRPFDEPWYLVWWEALLTNSKVQLAVIVALVGLVAFVFWPRGSTGGASLGSIVRHPERFEGRSVVVRGEVLEIFQVGIGHAFQLRQGRDMVVVYSTLREPRLHERVEVQGTVSTGYLDGAPRVAIFEGAKP